MHTHKILLTFTIFAGFILLFTPELALGQSCIPNCTSTQGECVFGSDDVSICSCYSGYDGTNCSDRVIGCDGSFYNVTSLETDYPPTLASNSFTGGTLTLNVEGALVNDRRTTEVSLNDDTFEDVCRYPGPNWSKDSVNDTCKDRFTGTLLWSEAQNCSWSVNTSLAGSLIYSGHILVKHNDYIDTFRGEEIFRVSEHVIPITITFDTQITVNSSITIFDNANLLSAVTQQSYNFDTGVGTLKISTSLQWPFELTNVLLDSYPSGLSSVLAETTNKASTCNNDTDTACFQIFEITITPSTACILSGEYVVTYNISCRGDQNDCPLTNDETGNITATLSSEDFCGDVEINAGLGGSLTSYEDAAYSTAREDFQLGSTAIFRIDVTSDAGVSLSNTSILEVWLEWDSGAQTVSLYNNGIQAGGTGVSFAILDQEPFFAGFSFVPTDPTTPIAIDEIKSFTVFCKVEVSYTGAPSSKKREQMIFSFTRDDVTETGGSQNFRASTDVIIRDDSNVENDDKSSSTNLISFFSSII